jgi:hypothetical protein
MITPTLDSTDRGRTGMAKIRDALDMAQAGSNAG